MLSKFLKQHFNMPVCSFKDARPGVNIWFNSEDTACIAHILDHRPGLSYASVSNPNPCYCAP